MMLRNVATAVATLAVFTQLPSTASARWQEPAGSSAASPAADEPAAAVAPSASGVEPVQAADDELPPPRPALAAPRPSTADEGLAEQREKLRKLRIRGVATLTVGGALVVLGGGLAGGYSNGSFGPKVLWAGVGLAAVGVPVFVGGMIAFAVANKRTRALPTQGVAALRVAPMLARGQAGLTIGGRF